MDSLYQLLNHLYRITLIPMYVFEQQKVLYCVPEQDPLTYPPAQYVNQLLNKHDRVSHTTSSFFSYYGGIPVREQQGVMVVIGPVSQVHYTQDTLRVMKKEYVINPEYDQDFKAFFSTIPAFHFQHFIHVLIGVNFLINQQELDFYQYLQQEVYEESSMKPIVREITTEEDEDDKEATINAYNLEAQLLKYVEEGNREGIRRIIEKPFVINEGSIAFNNIRQTKNIAIVTITLITRAAIRGGVPPKVAFQLSDEYIKQVENLVTFNSIVNLHEESALHFTDKVVEYKYNLGNTPELKHLILYIQQNTSLPLTVNSLAEKFNYSRSYLSERFKAKTGVSLSQFILQTKLQEAQNLLLSTDKSISEISTYLCFSSQSHFQTAFKNRFHISPAKFRRENYRLV